MPAPAAAVLFDVDGTLLDTNYLHVMAWWESFLEGARVSCFDIHRNIGRGSDDLVRRCSATRTTGRRRAQRALGPLRQADAPFHRAADLRPGLRGQASPSCSRPAGAPEDVEDFRSQLDCDDAVARGGQQR